MFDVSDNSVIGFYAQQRRRSKALNIMFWVLQSLAAVAFLIAGATKHAVRGPAVAATLIDIIHNFTSVCGCLESVGHRLLPLVESGIQLSLGLDLSNRKR